MLTVPAECCVQRATGIVARQSHIAIIAEACPTGCDNFAIGLNSYIVRSVVVTKIGEHSAIPTECGIQRAICIVTKDSKITGCISIIANTSRYDLAICL